MVGQGEEVAPPAGASAPLGDHPPELLRIGASGLAVDGGDQRLVRYRFQVERDEPLHGPESHRAL
jgi:hypothetical protein